MQMVGQQNNTKPLVVVGKKDKTMKEARGTCWVGYKQVGMKDKGGRKVPNCVKETTEIFYEENGQSHGYTLEYLRLPEDINEAEYQGRKVKLGKPMQGDVKKFKVYVKNPAGNVVKVNFGHKGKGGEKTMRIRKSNPDARKNFRARHNCDSPGPRHKARYWSCRSEQDTIVIHQDQDIKLDTGLVANGKIKKLTERRCKNSSIIKR